MAAEGRHHPGAESAGIDAQFERRATPENFFGHVFTALWQRARDVSAWTLRVPKAGRYRVEVVYGAAHSSECLEHTITAGKARLAGKVAHTTKSQAFQKCVVGQSSSTPATRPCASRSPRAAAGR